jgi:murein DD-endopeptidase MepM/ murein hydrolase activator NlpD
MSKYQFNRDQLRFVEVGRDIKGIIRKVVMGIVVSLALAVAYYFLFSSFFNTPEEQRLIQERQVLSQEYDRVRGKMEAVSMVLDDLEERDKEIYRTLFKSDPPDIANETQSSIALYQAPASVGHYDLVYQADTIYKRLEQKAEQMNGLFRAIVLSMTPEKIASIPDMVPIQDVDINRVGATVGARIHPYYKTIRMHNGLDYIAALGADVLAPANGTVTEVVRSERGSGNTVTIEHAFGYRTVYAHLSTIFVRKGQNVTKGMIIARVGNSGMSFATHLHYEIWKGEELMNPIHFCYSQLTPEKYRQLMIAGYNSGQSLD